MQTINGLGKKAREGTISIDDMAGGTFTISNGGVYGSLLSTPIINPPQSAILGMHSINQRAMVCLSIPCTKVIFSRARVDLDPMCWWATLEPSVTGCGGRPPDQPLRLSSYKLCESLHTRYLLSFHVWCFSTAMCVETIPSLLRR